MKLLSAVVAAAGIAGVLTLLPGAKSAQLPAHRQKAEQVSLEACVDLNCNGARSKNCGCNY